MKFIKFYGPMNGEDNVIYGEDRKCVVLIFVQWSLHDADSFIIDSLWWSAVLSIICVLFFPPLNISTNLYTLHTTMTVFPLHGT